MKWFGDVLNRGSLRDPVTAIMGGAGLLTNVIGGVVGSKAAKKAANDQAAAAKAAAAKVADATAAANPHITEAAANAGHALTTTAGDAASGVAAATDRANLLLDPYRAAGNDATDELGRNLVAGGDFNRDFTRADFEADPGYEFRREEGARGIERGQAARGGALGGAALKELERYRQGVASQEFQSAFDRFRTQKNDRFSRLNIVSGRGQDAAGVEGSNLIDAGKYGGDITTGASRTAGGWDVDAANQVAANDIGSAKVGAEYDTQAANAQAAGKVASTNLLMGGITGGVNAATSAVQFGRVENLLKNPAAGLSTPTAAAPKPGSLRLNLLQNYGKKAA